MRRAQDLGFTVIELMVVFSILAIMSTGGIVGFVLYSRTQNLNTATSDFVTTLAVAKSRTQSQVKTCPAGVLDGYKVSLLSLTSYQLSAICVGNSYSSVTHTFPKNISFDSTTPIPSSFLFRTLTGAVDGADALGTTITIHGYGTDLKRVTIYQDGRIVTD